MKNSEQPATFLTKRELLFKDILCALISPDTIHYVRDDKKELLNTAIQLTDLACEEWLDKENASEGEINPFFDK